MTTLIQTIATSSIISALSASAFAHPEHTISDGLIAGREHMFWAVPHLLPIIAVGLVVVLVARYVYGRSDRGAAFLDWLLGRRR